MAQCAISPVDISKGAYPSLQALAEQPLDAQDLIQASDDQGCDYRYFAESPSAESEVSTFASPNTSQAYDDDSSYDQESSLDGLSYEIFGETLAEGTPLWRESVMWSVLHDEWPRLD
jgi:hypothetical protein